MKTSPKQVLTAIITDGKNKICNLCRSKLKVSSRGKKNNTYNNKYFACTTCFSTFEYVRDSLQTFKIGNVWYYFLSKLNCAIRIDYLENITAILEIKNDIILGSKRMPMIFPFPITLEEIYYKIELLNNFA